MQGNYRRAVAAPVQVTDVDSVDGGPILGGVVRRSRVSAQRSIPPKPPRLLVLVIVAGFVYADYIGLHYCHQLEHLVQ